jgi:hypothetical protein
MRQAMLINCSTYGWFYPDTNIFECTHGGWEGKVTFIDDVNCTVNVISRPCTYKFIEEIPADYFM